MLSCIFNIFNSVEFAIETKLNIHHMVKIQRVKMDNS